jgi:peptidoglycan hydrolase CwlO-like protein
MKPQTGGGMRKRFATSCAALLLLTGCNSREAQLEQQVQELQEQLDDAHSQITELKQHAEEVSAASDRLKAQMDRFQGWELARCRAGCAGRI